MGCCGSKNVEKSRSGSTWSASSQVKGAVESMTERLVNESGSIRGSFRMSKPAVRLKVKWGEEAHCVHSEHRKRRLSDQSLSMVMESGPINDAFLSFMNQVNNQKIVLAWLDLSQFDKYCSENVEGNTKKSGERRKIILEKAQQIYSNFFADSENEFLLPSLSSSTFSDLKHDFMVDSEGRLCQSNINVLADVYKVLHLRIHNVLKYEYLPGFLASEQFFNIASLQASVTNPNHLSHHGELDVHIEVENENADEEDFADFLSEQEEDPPQDTRDRFEEVSEFVQDSEKSRFFFEFVFMEARSIDNLLDPAEARSRRISLQEKMQVRRESHSLLKHIGVVELFLEMEDLLDPQTKPDAMLKRFNRILSRYGPSKQDLLEPPMRTIQDLYQVLDIADQGPLTELPQDLQELLKPVKGEILQRIRKRILPAFKRSNTYRLMQRESRHSILGVFSNNDSFKKAKQHETECAKDPVLAALERDPLLQDRSTTSLSKRSKSEGADPESARVIPKFTSAPQSKKRRSMGKRIVEVPTEPKVVELELDTRTPEVTTAEQLETLNRLKEDVNVGPKHFSTPFSTTSLTITLEEVLQNSYGILQLKRFARKMFQEENILFLVEVKQLKKNVELSSREDLYELLHRAQSICNQYVNPGSSLEINISDTQRQETLHRFLLCSQQYVQLIKSADALKQGVEMSSSSPKKSKTELQTGGSVSMLETQLALIKEVDSIFDVALKEVTTMVQRGLWESFKDDRMYEDYIQRRGFYHMPHACQSVPASPRDSLTAADSKQAPPTPKTFDLEELITSPR